MVAVNAAFCKQQWTCRGECSYIEKLLAKLPTPNIKSEEFQEALIELRNTPRHNGQSPNMIVFGKNLRSRVPAHYESFDRKWQIAAEDADAKFKSNQAKIQEHYDRNARDLKPFRVGDKVRIQDHTTKRWTHIGDIVGVGEHRDYRVKLPSGRTWWRNRRFLRRYHQPIEEDDNADEDEPSSTTPKSDPKQKVDDNDDVPHVRRSTRVKQTPKRYGDNN